MPRTYVVLKNGNEYAIGDHIDNADPDNCVIVKVPKTTSSDVMIEIVNDIKKHFDSNKTPILVTSELIDRVEVRPDAIH